MWMHNQKINILYLSLFLFLIIFIIKYFEEKTLFYNHSKNVWFYDQLFKSTSITIINEKIGQLQNQEPNGMKNTFKEYKKTGMEWNGMEWNRMNN